MGEGRHRLPGAGVGTITLPDNSQDVSLAVTTPVLFEEAATISGDSSPAALFGDSMTFQQRDSGPRRQLPAEAPSAGYGDTADYSSTTRTGCVDITPSQPPAEGTQSSQNRAFD